MRTQSVHNVAHDIYEGWEVNASIFSSEWKRAAERWLRANDCTNDDDS